MEYCLAFKKKRKAMERLKWYSICLASLKPSPNPSTTKKKAILTRYIMETLTAL
jgi:hypothetical protein